MWELARLFAGRNPVSQEPLCWGRLRFPSDDRMEADWVSNLRLPVGIVNFEEICTEGFYHVDKTGLVRDLLHSGKTSACLPDSSVSEKR